MDAALYAHQLQQQHRRNNNTNTTQPPLTFDSFRIVLQEENFDTKYIQHHNIHHYHNSTTTHVHVFLRPGCIPFLSHITQLYPTYIYTAAQSVYANPILDHLSHAVQSYQAQQGVVGVVVQQGLPLVQQGVVQQQIQQGVPPNPTTTTTTTNHHNDHHHKNCIFRGRFYREHCIFDSRTNQYYKDLTQLHRHNRNCTITEQTQRMVLLDNNPVSLLKNPHNGILVDSFYGPFQPPVAYTDSDNEEDDEDDEDEDDDNETDENRRGTPPRPAVVDRTFAHAIQYLQELSTVPDVRPIIAHDKQRWDHRGISGWDPTHSMVRTAAPSLFGPQAVLRQQRHRFRPPTMGNVIVPLP